MGKRFLIAAMVLIFMCMLVPAQALPDGMPRFPARELLLDFWQVLGLIKTHPNAYRFIDVASFDRRAREIESRIVDPMSETEFYALVSPLVASIGCGHSFLSLTEKREMSVESSSKRLPVQIMVLEGLPLVVDNLGNAAFVPGSEILEINGRSMVDIINEMKSLISSDRSNDNEKTLAINNRFGFWYALVAKDAESVSFLLKDPSGRQYQVVSTMVARDYFRRQSRSSFIARPRTFDMISDDTAYLRVADFMDIDQCASLFDIAFTRIAEDKSARLILDLRGNRGGAPEAGSLLLSYLLEKPFVYFSTSYPGYADQTSPAAINEKAFTGQLVILIDGGCASTTGHVLSLLKFHGRGTMIGEESGGTWTCNDAGVITRLRNTGMSLRMAKRVYSTAVRDMPVDRGIMPDVPVKQTFADWFSLRDTVLQAVLAYGK